MKCPNCRGVMETRRENHRYIESGLPNVVLLDVEIRHCPSCGERTVGITAMEELHRLLAHEIIRRPGRLAPQEIRFLRKWLGLSGKQFADRMGVDPATVSRWESAKNPQPMNTTADILIRHLVAFTEPEHDYSATGEFVETQRPAGDFRVRPVGRSWRSATNPGISAPTA